MNDKLPLTNFSTDQAQAVIWQALHEYQDAVIPVIPDEKITNDAIVAQAENNAETWDEICTAMAWIKDALAPLQDGEHERISLVEAIEAVPDMDHLATAIQYTINTPELRDLIDALVNLYEPTDDMLHTKGEKPYPDCLTV